MYHACAQLPVLGGVSQPPISFKHQSPIRSEYQQQTEKRRSRDQVASSAGQLQHIIPAPLPGHHGPCRGPTISVYLWVFFFISLFTAETDPRASQPRQPRPVISANDPEESKEIVKKSEKRSFFICPPILTTIEQQSVWLWVILSVYNLARWFRWGRPL